MIIESILSDTLRTCDESCEHCDPDNEICTKHQMGIEPYQKCLDESVNKHSKGSARTLKLTAIIREEKE